MITRGTALSNRGRPREAMALLHEALKIAEEHGLVGTKLRALANIGFGSPDPQESVAATDAGYLESRRLGDKSHLQFFAGNWSPFRIFTGDFDAPVTITDDPVFADAPADWWSGHYAYLAMASATRGEFDRAKNELAKARELAAGSDEAQLLAILQRSSITIAWAEGRFREKFSTLRNHPPCRRRAATSRRSSKPSRTHRGSTPPEPGNRHDDGPNRRRPRSSQRRLIWFLTHCTAGLVRHL